MPTFQTCRYCKKQGYANYLKYGPRHYAHLRCLHAALTADAFESVLTNKVPRHVVKNIPYFEARELGILNLLHKITGQDHELQHADINVVIDKFPKTFGLVGFPGKVFRISRSSSYISDNRVVLYTQVLERSSNTWLDFAKGSESELREQLVNPQEFVKIEWGNGAVLEGRVVSAMSWSQHGDNWYIELIDKAGKYTYYKQQFDGGTVTFIPGVQS